MKDEQILFLDIETSGGPFDGNLIVAGWCLGDEPIHSDVKDWSPELLDLLRDRKVTKVCHSDFDLKWPMLNMGLSVAGPFINTMVLAWCMNEMTPLDLEWVVGNYCGLVKDKHIFIRKDKLFFKYETDDPRQEMLDYNVNDVEVLRSLYFTLRALLKDSDRWDFFIEEQLPYSKVILDMECMGLPINSEKNRALLAKLERETAVERMWLYNKGNLPMMFNIDSDQQVAKFLFEKDFTIKGRLPVGDSDPSFFVEKVGRLWQTGHWVAKGLNLEVKAWTKPDKETTPPKPSTSAPDLLYTHGDNEWVNRLCTKYRKTTTLVEFLGRFEELAHDGRLYSSYKQTGTVTGRLSSAEPNLQNVPKRGERGKLIRGLFEGDLTIGDYDQLEARIAGHWSGDPNLVETFKTNTDIHLVTACNIFGSEALNESCEIHGKQNMRGLWERVSSPANSSPAILHGTEQMGGTESLLETMRGDSPPNSGGSAGRNSAGEVLCLHEGTRPSESEFERVHPQTYLGSGKEIGEILIPVGSSTSYRRERLEQRPEQLVGSASVSKSLACSCMPELDEYREISKTLLYGMFYGAGAKKVAQTLSLQGYATTIDTAKTYLEEVENTYSVWFEYRNWLISEAKRTGYVETIGGWRRRLFAQFEDVADGKKVSYGERQAVNAKIQGSAADIVRRLMIARPLNICLQVHDEVGWLNCPYPLADLQYMGEIGHGFKLNIPLVFQPHVVENWGQK